MVPASSWPLKLICSSSLIHLPILSFTKAHNAMFWALWGSKVHKKGLPGNIIQKIMQEHNARIAFNTKKAIMDGLRQGWVQRKETFLNSVKS